MWRRGERSGRETEACDFDLRSRKSGRGFDMARFVGLNAECNLHAPQCARS